MVTSSFHKPILPVIHWQILSGQRATGLHIRGVSGRKMIHPQPSHDTTRAQRDGRCYVTSGEPHPFYIIDIYEWEEAAALEPERYVLDRRRSTGTRAPSGDGSS